MLRRLESPRVLSDLGIGERSVCLDIGCGSGMGALLINQYLDCEKVVGIDVDPDMVAAAEEYVSHPPKWAKSGFSIQRFEKKLSMCFVRAIR